MVPTILHNKDANYTTFNVKIPMTHFCFKEVFGTTDSNLLHADLRELSQFAKSTFFNQFSSQRLAEYQQELWQKKFLYFIYCVTTIVKIIII